MGPSKASTARRDPDKIQSLRYSRGVSLLEFTVVLPILLVLLLGIVELSLILYDQAMITNAAREGARFGIAFDAAMDAYPSETQITAVVDNYLQNHMVNFGSDSPDVTFPTTGTATGDPLTVRVKYTYSFLVLPNFVSSFTGDLDLAAEAVMRMQ